MKAALGGSAGFTRTIPVFFPWCVVLRCCVRLIYKKERCMEDLTAYQDPAHATLESGRTVAESIRPGPGGVKGAVVRRSDQFGVPIGQKPNEVAPQVIVDPDEAGQGFVVDMTKMSKTAMAAAVANVKVTPSMDESSKATEIMRQFAVGREPPQPQQQVVAPPPAAPVPPSSPQQVQLPPVQPLPQPGASQQVSLFAQIDKPAEQKSPYSPEPPSEDLVPRLKASFQSRNAPCTQDGFFHQIIRQGPNLILVFDTRAIGYPRTRPQAMDEDVAVHLEGSSVLYITQTTGIEFNCDNKEYCVLLIKEEHPFQIPGDHANT